MKVLFITEQFPFPLQDGGNLRTYHVLQGLSHRHDVCLLSHSPKDPSVDSTALPFVDRVITVPKPSLGRRISTNLGTIGVRDYPLFVLKNWSQSLFRQAETLLAAERFDAIHFNHLDTACFACVREWPQKKIFDSHNCLSALAAQVSREKSSWARRTLYAREARCLGVLEREACRQMDVILTCSEEDADGFRELGVQGTLTVAPNGVNTDFFSASELREEAGNLVFAGAMNYYPNEQAALHFCREILPLLHDCEPPVRLFLVGKSPTRAVRSLHDDASVFVTGRVDDVRPFLSRSQIVVVPLLHGSGTRLKILEAFAMGKVVVSTSRGAEGIPAQDGRQIFLADDPRSFSQQLRRLLASPALRAEVGRAAQKLVREQFDWTHINDRVLGAYGALAEECLADVG